MPGAGDRCLRVRTRLRTQGHPGGERRREETKESRRLRSTAHKHYLESRAVEQGERLRQGRGKSKGPGRSMALGGVGQALVQLVRSGDSSRRS